MGRSPRTPAHRTDQVIVWHDQYKDVTTIDARPGSFYHETSAAGKVLMAPLIAGGVLGVAGLAASLTGAATKHPSLGVAAAVAGIFGAGLLASSFFGSISAPGAPQPYL